MTTIVLVMAAGFMVLITVVGNRRPWLAMVNPLPSPPHVPDLPTECVPHATGLGGAVDVDQSTLKGRQRDPYNRVYDDEAREKTSGCGTLGWRGWGG